MGEGIAMYVSSLGAFVPEDHESSIDWVRYSIPDYDVCIDVEDKIIVSVTSYSEFLYKGLNLIGMNIIELGQALDCTADEIGETIEYDDGESKTPYEYFGLGLQIWVSEGEVVSASCLSYDDD